MTDLGRSARELLDIAKRADSAPVGHLPNGRGRLMATLATGAVTTSAFAAKGALLVASPTVGTTATSLVSTLVSAVAIGIATGLMALSPASSIPDPPRSEQSRGTGSTSTNLAPRAQVSPKHERTRPALAETTPPVEAPATVTAPMLAPAPVTSPTEAPAAVIAPMLAPAPVTSPTEAPAAVIAPMLAPAPVTSPTEAPAAVIAPNQPTRASIAQETALLADAQRALKAGRAAMALEALDRYEEQFPAGLLQEEATVSRVLALCALGRVQDARRWADEFQRRYPASPLLPRIRNACSSQDPQSSDETSSND